LRSSTAPAALLAFFSLAAEGMRTDETFRSNNYYARLVELLGAESLRQRPGIEELSRDFRKDSLTLWNALNAWLLDAGGARGLPTAYSFDWRSFVGVPISQALLREEERLALRDMFVRYRLRPGQQIAASDMVRLLEDWLPGSDFSEGIKRLFRQSDAKARLADIAAIELEHWDGTVPASVEGARASTRRQTSSPMSCRSKQLATGRGGFYPPRLVRPGGEPNARPGRPRAACLVLGRNGDVRCRQSPAAQSAQTPAIGSAARQLRASRRRDQAVSGGLGRRTPPGSGRPATRSSSGVRRGSAKCPRQESNLRTRFRKPLLYPLSYGGGTGSR
jgi:hypothetical protein